MANSMEGTIFTRWYQCRTAKEAAELRDKIESEYDKMVDILVEEKKGFLSKPKPYTLTVTTKVTKDKDGLLYDITARAYK